jgi:hypothetical protein
VRFSWPIDPSARLTSTTSSSRSISFGWPSTRYVVGEPGASVSSNGVKRNAVDTVWLHAKFCVLPMSTIGTPNSDPPCTSTLPGIVRCVW